MQVSSKSITQKQTGLERKAQNNEKISSEKANSNNIKTFENDGIGNVSERNETSQYLKVLSRIENLLFQKKLPDAAVEGFIGALKNQIDLMGEDDKQMILKMPEANFLELKNLDNLPDIIRNNIKNEEKIPELFNFLKLPRFAAFMQTETAKVSKTYSVQNLKNSNNKNIADVSVLDIPGQNKKQSVSDLSDS